MKVDPVTLGAECSTCQKQINTTLGPIILLLGAAAVGDGTSFINPLL